MADRYLLESGAPDGFLLEDGTGVLLLDDGYVVGQMVEFSLGSSLITVDSPNFTAVAGDTLVAVVIYSDSDFRTVTMSDTVGSNDTWTQCESGIYYSSSALALHVFYLVSAAAGSSTIRATFDVSTNNPGICITPVTKLLSASVFEAAAFAAQSAPGFGIDAITTANLAVLSTQPQMIFGVTVVNTGAVTPAIGTGFTSIGVGRSLEGVVKTNLMRVEHKRVTTTAATAATFTQLSTANQKFITATVAFKEFVATLSLIPTIHMARYVTGEMRQ